MVGILVTSCLASITLASAGTSVLHQIDLTRYPLARCLDGSPGAFYLWGNTSASAGRKWVVWHVGGGWCSMDVPDNQMLMGDECYNRSFGQTGSSDHYPPVAPTGWTLWGMEGAMSEDAAVNPLMHDWNKVSMVYCDGSSFSSRNLTTTVVRGRQLFLQGSYILEAIIGTLVSEYGLGHATDLVVAGSSAGGLATFLHVDKWRLAVPESTFVVGMPDGGFFADWYQTKPAGSVSSWDTMIRGNFHAFNVSAGIQPACVAARVASRGSPADCYFADHAAPFVNTPLFVIQSVVDAWQLENILGNTENVLLVNFYRKHLTSRLLDSVLARPGNSGFIDSCVHHCHFWHQISIDGMRLSDAFGAWYASVRSFWEAGRPPSVGKARWQARAYPCIDCCPLATPEHPSPLSVGPLRRLFGDAAATARAILV